MLKRCYSTASCRSFIAPSSSPAFTSSSLSSFSASSSVASAAAARPASSEPSPIEKEEERQRQAELDAARAGNPETALAVSSSRGDEYEEDGAEHHETHSSAGPAGKAVKPIWAKDSVRACRMEIPISPQKLNDICRLARGMNCEEALLQLRLNDRKKTYFVANAIKNAMRAGKTIHGMETQRMYVAQLWVGKAKYVKRPDIKGRGHTGTKRRYRAHLWVKIREQKVEEKEKYQKTWTHGGRSHDKRTGEEIRIGRAGPKLTSLARTLSNMQAWRVAHNLPKNPSKENTKEGNAAAQGLVETDLESLYGEEAVAKAFESSDIPRPAFAVKVHKPRVLPRPKPIHVESDWVQVEHEEWKKKAKEREERNAQKLAEKLRRAQQNIIYASAEGAAQKGE